MFKKLSKQTIILMIIILVYLIVPGLENSLNAIKVGDYIYNYFLTAVITSYVFGFIIDHTVYMFLSNRKSTKTSYRFLIQLTISITILMLIVFYQMALMKI